MVRPTVFVLHDANANMPSHFLVVAALLAVISGHVQPSVSVAPRPVRDTTQPPDPAKIEFVSFEFQRPQLFELSAHYSRIEEDPSIGVEYGVEASIGGEEAIATASFDVVDENGNDIQRIAMVAEPTGVALSSNFVGFMVVPARSFRIVLSGEAVDGQKFRRVSRLFRPVDRPDLGWQLPPDLPKEEREAFQQMYDTLAPKALEERRALVAANPSGRIVMPRTRVSNVRYAPVLSATGRLLGLRLTYDVEFSQNGRNNPEVHVFAEDKEDFIRGRNPLHAVKSTIDPLPRLYWAPEKEPEDIPGLLAQRADFLYKAGTRYRFTVDLVPDFVSVKRDKTTPCIYLPSRPGSDPESKALARRLANGGPTTYRVAVGFTMFEGIIDEFSGEGAFYQNFRAEGVQDCSEWP